MWVNLQSIRKNVFTSKKWTNKNDKNHGKAGALWQTLRLSFALYGQLIFHLQTLCDYWLYFGFSPGWSYFLIPSCSSCLLAWIQIRIWRNGDFSFPWIQTCVQSMFSGLHFLQTNISQGWWLIIQPTFCPTYSNKQKS